MKDPLRKRSLAELDDVIEEILERNPDFIHRIEGIIQEQLQNFEMKPCPFCGHPVDLDDPDTLYPNAVGWKMCPDGHRSYHSFRDVPPEQWCYSIHCVSTAGGCGAEISGDSEQECIDKWNRRV